jgi:hypothetical protein
MQAEWQRLYDATSGEDELTTAADFAWQDYSDHVWPLVHSNSFTAPAGGVDYPAQLLTLRATTPEGIQTKAAAIIAMDEAATYCDGRDDSYQLCLSLLRNAATSAYQPLGEAQPQPNCLAAARRSRPGHPRRVGHPDQDGTEGEGRPNRA